QLHFLAHVLNERVGVSRTVGMKLFHQSRHEQAILQIAQRALWRLWVLTLGGFVSVQIAERRLCRLTARLPTSRNPEGASVESRNRQGVWSRSHQPPGTVRRRILLQDTEN